MKLTNKQKEWLFDNGYVTAKVLDAVVEPGWKNYFIKSFDWELAGVDRYGLERLYLIDKGKWNIKDKGEIVYTIGLIFQDNDYNELQNIRG
jgi:hypothetical protein